MFFLCIINPEMALFLIADLQKVGQDYGAQVSQLHHSMTNVKIYKCLPHIFALALIVSDI